MLTSCPSSTPFGLDLGPANPATNDVAQETLDFRRMRFSRIFTLLMPAFALLCAPPLLTERLRRAENAPLPLRQMAEAATSAAGLSPDELSAHGPLTSELLRTL